MSLESAIQANTEAITRLQAAIERLLSGAAAPTAEPVKEKKARTPKAEPVPEPKTPEVVAPKIEDLEKQASDILQQLLDLQQKPKIIELNQKFGVARWRELIPTPDKFATYIKEAAALLESVKPKTS